MGGRIPLGVGSVNNNFIFWEKWEDFQQPKIWIATLLLVARNDGQSNPHNPRELFLAAREQSERLPLVGPSLVVSDGTF
jgi:hypothetical protein